MTVRERDTQDQVRLPLDEACVMLERLVTEKTTWAEEAGRWGLIAGTKAKVEEKGECKTDRPCETPKVREQRAGRNVYAVGGREGGRKGGREGGISSGEVNDEVDRDIDGEEGEKEQLPRRPQ